MREKTERAKALAAKWIRDYEQYIPKPYPDPGDGSRRIGYGAACPDTMEECSWIMAEGMLQVHLEDCAEEIYGCLGPTPHDAMKMERLAVLYAMCYQLGYTRLCKFKRMLTAIRDHDYEAAAFEMTVGRNPDEPSGWMNDTPKRCEHMARVFRTGRSR